MSKIELIKRSKKFDKLSAFDYALYLLSIQAQSSGQLRAKLVRKKYLKDEIEAAIVRLTDLGCLNDDQFAQIYFENLLKYKQFGYFGIKRKLIERKLDPAAIEKLLAGLSLKQETEVAKKVFAKFGGRKSQAQLVRMLSSRGFRGEVIYKLTRLDPEA